MDQDFKFNVELAVELGINAAVVYEYIKSSFLFNGRPFYNDIDKRSYTPIKNIDFTNDLSFMCKGSIKKAINVLVKFEYINKEDLLLKHMDRTLYYTVLK